MANDRKNDPTPEAPRSFAVFFTQVADGDLERVASEKLYKLMKLLRAEAAMAGGRAKGAMTIKIACEVQTNGELDIRHNVSVKEPEPTSQKSTMWLNPQGNVVFEPPRQQKLFREVTKDGGTVEIEDRREVKEI